MNLLLHKWGRRLFAFVFYFAEGAPIGLIWWALPAVMKNEGLAIDRITALTALLTLPWVLKFIWAPVVDVLRTRSWGYTRWIATAQIAMCLTLLPLIFIPLPGNLAWWSALLLLHSFFAATQDVAVDALVIRIADPNEKGVLNGYMQAGMLTGRSIFGGAVLVLVPVIGLSGVVGLMASAIFLVTLLLFLVREPANEFTEPVRLSSFGKKLFSAFAKRSTWLGLAFALTGAAAFEAAGGMSGAFLTDKGAPLSTVGFFFGLPVVGSMLAGGLIGGAISDRIPRRRAVAVFLLCVVAMLGLLAVWNHYSPAAPFTMWMTLFSAVYFFTGMFTAASYAWFMDLCDPRVGATQFSTFMAATNGCESWVIWSAGTLAASGGYSVAFLVMCGVSLLSLVFLSFRRKLKHHEDMQGTQHI